MFHLVLLHGAPLLLSCSFANFHGVVSHYKIGALCMSVVEYEVKRHDVWREELRKKNKAYILFVSFASSVWAVSCVSARLLYSWPDCLCVCVYSVSSLTLFCARESAPENGSLRRDQDKALRKYHGLLAKQEQLLRGRPAFQLSSSVSNTNHYWFVFFPVIWMQYWCIQ